MLFMTYKLKVAKNVKAEKVTVENINEIAASFVGAARVRKNGEDDFTLQILTFDGPVDVKLNQWVVRHENSIEAMDDESFKEKYERARTVREG